MKEKLEFINKNYFQQKKKKIVIINNGACNYKTEVKEQIKLKIFNNSFHLENISTHFTFITKII